MAKRTYAAVLLLVALLVATAQDGIAARDPFLPIISMSTSASSSFFAAAAVQPDTIVTNFGAIGDGKFNDAPAFKNAWEAVCKHGTSKSPITIPAGKTFLLQPVKFDGPCTSNATIVVEVMGKLEAPVKSQWQPHPDGSNWISFSNVPNLVINGRSGHEVNGRGKDWWNDKLLRQRPTALGFHGCNNLQVNKLRSVDPPKNHISIDGCNGATITGITLIAPETASNTDGIDISKSTDVKIIGGSIGTGDDCIAINSGCKTINVTGLTCGPGHGISVGSLGKKGEIADVDGVHVKNCTFIKTQNAARIKTWQNGVGQASHITFEDIILNQADNPIYINQHYCDAHSELPCPKTETTAVKLSDVSFVGFRGSTIDGKAPINMNCSEVEPCQDVTLDNIHMTGPASMEPFCDNVQGTARDVVPPLPMGCMQPAFRSILRPPVDQEDDHDILEGVVNIRQRLPTVEAEQLAS